MKVKKYLDSVTGEIYKNILFWSLLVGAVGLLAGYTNMFFDEPNSLQEVFKVMGTVILSSGVFMAIAKSYQFTNIFQDELRKVIYAEEDLANRNDLDELWVRVTEALCKKKFAPISKRLLKAIRNYYLPLRQDYYYKDHSIDINIEYDAENPGYIILKEEIEATIVVESPEGCAYEYRSDIPTPPSDNGLTYYKLNELVVNGQKVDFNKKNQLDIDRNESSVNVKMIYYCKKGKREYTIKRAQEKRYHLESNPFRSHLAICVYNNFSLHLTYPLEMKIEWIDRGVLGRFNKSFKTHNSHKRLKANYQGVIFKNQGFLIIYR